MYIYVYVYNTHIPECKQGEGVWMRDALFPRSRSPVYVGIRARIYIRAWKIFYDDDATPAGILMPRKEAREGGDGLHGWVSYDPLIFWYKGEFQMSF